MKKQRQGKGQIFAFEISISFSLIYLILSFVDFRHCPTYHSRYTWMGCVWKVGNKRERNVEGSKVLWFDYLSPHQHFFLIPISSVMVWSGGAFSNSSKKDERNTSKAILWGQDYPDTKTRQGHHKKRKYWLLSQINIDAKILNKILENQIQQCMKKILDNPLQYSCLGNLRRRSLASYSPLDRKVSNTT